MTIWKLLRRWLRGEPIPDPRSPTPALDGDCDCELDTVKIEIVAAPEVVYWCVVAVQRLGCGGFVSHRSRVCETPATALLYARRLAQAGYDVDVYRWPCAGADAEALSAGRQVRSARHEAALGLRPALRGTQAIGVG